MIWFGERAKENCYLHVRGNACRFTQHRNAQVAREVQHWTPKMEHAVQGKVMWKAARSRSPTAGQAQVQRLIPPGHWLQSKVRLALGVGCRKSGDSNALIPELSKSGRCYVVCCSSSELIIPSVPRYSSAKSYQRSRGGKCWRGQCDAEKCFHCSNNIHISWGVMCRPISSRGCSLS